MKKFYLYILMALISIDISAQFNIDAGSTNYNQNFDGLGTSGGTWTDNTTLTGWYARTDATSSIVTYGANTGSTTGAGLYSYGVLGTNPLTERALGYGTSNAFTGASGVGKNYLGWRLKNNTGGTITSITVTWTGEQWRRENVPVQSLILTYQTGVTVTALIGGTWNATGSTFPSPQNSAAAGALDGNAPANRTAGISTIITVTLLPGEEIMLRWEDLNDSGNDHHFAIDDVIVNATVAAPAGTSTITAGPGTEAPLISSLINSLGTSILNFDFTIQDDGATPGTDANATQITQIVLTAGTGNTVSNWNTAIESIQIYDEDGISSNAIITSNTITFFSLPGSPGNLGHIPDNESRTYRVYLSLKTDLTTLKTVIDGQNFVFRIQNSGITTNGGSQLASGQDINSGASNNEVDVAATLLAFVQHPTTTGINAAMSPNVTVSANDINGNRDLDFIESVRITSSGTLTGSPVDVTAASGLATFIGLTHSAGGNGLTLNAERTTTLDFDVTSSPFNIINPSNATDYFRSKAPGGNWNAIGTWESSADAITWNDATLIPDAMANIITIRNGHTVTLNVAVTADQVVIENGGILDLNANLTLNDGTGTDLTVNGTVINTSGTHTVSGTITFNANSVYRHNRNGQPILTATWDVTSTAEITGITGTAPSGLSQAFGNFTWNSPGQTASINLSGGLTNVTGNLTIAHTSTTAGRVVRLFGSVANATTTIGGDLIINNVNARLEFSNGNATNSVFNIGGNFNLSAGSFSPNVTGTIAVNFTGVNKSFIHSGGTLTNGQINWFVTNPASLTLVNDLPVAAGRTLQIDGILIAGTLQITGAGSVLVNNILRTANVNGISSTGTIANTGGITLGVASTIDYNATVDQQFTSNSSYANVIISNGGNKLLNGISVIAGNLDLVSGRVITTSANLLILDVSATFTGGSVASFVDGPLQKNTNSTGAFTFPVGKGILYKPFDVTPATATGSSYIGEYFTPNINTTSPACNPVKLEAYTVNERWNVVRFSGTDNAAIRLNYVQSVSNGNWTNGTAPMPNPDNTKGITVATYLVGSGCWEVYPDITTLVVGDAASGQPATSALSIFGDFTFGYADFAALPVKIDFIEGAKQGGSHKITWKVICTNTPTAVMSLERSADGRNFSSIYNITATADRCLQSFVFNDANPVAGINYYRLRMTDADGRSSFSATIALLNKDNGFDIVSISPNPVINTASMSISSAVNAKMQLVISDITGKVVSRQNINLVAGSNIKSINLERLPAGAYQITGSLPGGEIRTLRFIKR